MLEIKFILYIFLKIFSGKISDHVYKKVRYTEFPKIRINQRFPINCTMYTKKVFVLFHTGGRFLLKIHI